jgi:hypothetical protein
MQIPTNLGKVTSKRRKGFEAEKARELNALITYSTRSFVIFDLERAIRDRRDAMSDEGLRTRIRTLLTK